MSGLAFVIGCAVITMGLGWVAESINNIAESTRVKRSSDFSSIATALHCIADALQRNPAPTRKAGESDGDFYRRILEWERNR